MFDAFTKPELVRRWLLGPDGWTMPVCEIDLRVGGRYRYLWRKEAIGKDMGMGGVFREVVRPARLVATEKFDDAWYPGEAVNTTTFQEENDVTSVRLVVLYESKEARDTASRSGMERGMIAGYDRLEALLASDVAGGHPQHLVDVPVVADTTPLLAAAIHVTIPRSEIRSVMGPGLTEIMSAVTAQGIGPAGPWFTHHFAMNPSTFDFEICVPVSAPVRPVGRVVSRRNARRARRACRLSRACTNSSPRAGRNSTAGWLRTATCRRRISTSATPWARTRVRTRRRGGPSSAGRSRLLALRDPRQANQQRNRSR